MFNLKCFSNRVVSNRYRVASNRYRVCVLPGVSRVQRGGGCNSSAVTFFSFSTIFVRLAHFLFLVASSFLFLFSLALFLSLARHSLLLSFYSYVHTIDHSHTFSSFHSFRILRVVPLTIGQNGIVMRIHLSTQKPKKEDNL